MNRNTNTEKADLIYVDSERKRKICQKCLCICSSEDLLCWGCGYNIRTQETK